MLKKKKNELVAFVSSIFAKPSNEFAASFWLYC